MSFCRGHRRDRLGVHQAVELHLPGLRSRELCSRELIHWGLQVNETGETTEIKSGAPAATAARSHWARRVAARLETLAELHYKQRARALGRRPSRGPTPQEQTLGRLPRDAAVERDRRFGRLRRRSRARRAACLRVRRVRLGPPQARQTLEKKKVQMKYYRVHLIVHEASHIASEVRH